MFLKISEVINEDLPKILHINQLTNCLDWSEGHFCIEKLPSPTIFLKASVNDEIIGFILGRTISSESEIFGIAVSPAEQHKGIGGKLLEAFEKRCLEFQEDSVKIVDIFLEVRELNCSAIRFYELNNFKVIAVRKLYYANPAENALIMKKELTKK